MSISSKRIVHLALAGLSCLALSATAVATSASTPAAQPDAAPAVAEAVSVHIWSTDALTALKAEVAAAGNEGLDPAAYGIKALDGAALGPDTDRAATRVATQLALDYARGSVDDPEALDWHIARPTVDAGQMRTGIEAAARENRLRPYLRALLPSDARYTALRDAYAATPAADIAMRDRLRANLERWRWMPRQLGANQIYVNIPSYTLAVIDQGRTVGTYTVVVGAPKTPTPQIAADARSVIVNPWWSVPNSIARTMHASASKGFVVDGGQIRQRPGPANALGKVKIDIANPYSIYLHDTPSKALFAKESRAFSHGCIRVKDIDKLALQLVALDKGRTAEVEHALTGYTTETVPLHVQRSVYLVYFTTEAGPDGRIVTHDDPYGRDAKLVATLDREVKMAANARRSGSAAA